MTRSGSVGKMRAQSQVGEKFSNVAHFLRKCSVPLHAPRCLGEKLFILLQRGAAPGGVGDDGIEIIAEKDVEIYARERSRNIAHARVSRERAAASLSRGNDDFAAVGRQHANRRFMQRGKTDLGDAPGE